MTAPGPATAAGASQQAAIDAALLLLDRMDLSGGDLLATPRARPALPTFAEYVPVVAGTVTAGTKRAYGSYWNRIVKHWGDRRLDEPTPSEILQLMTEVRAHVVPGAMPAGGAAPPSTW